MKPGDRVSQFDNICEVQSDKASVTITSRYDGLIKALHHKVDDVALIGESLLDIELDDVTVNGEMTESGDKEVAATRIEPETGGKNQELAESREKAVATPAVRRIAMENDIKLKDVVSTGKGGRVLKEDILAHLEKISAGPAGKGVVADREKPTTVPAKGYGKHMWKTMTQSLSIPHFVYSDECNVNKLMDQRDEVKDSLKRHQGVSLSLMPFFIKAASRALEKVPQLNAWLDEESQGVLVHDNHNIGIAMDTPEGLIVPNIKNVQRLNVVEIARELNRLQELGRKCSLQLDDLSNTTFSLSNIGVVGGTYTKPVILPPQIVIGAFGKIQKLPRFDEEGKVIAANIICVSWAADHRVVDGVTMARYSNHWKFYVENPAYLLMGA